MELRKLATQIAEKAHAGQLDESDLPYIEGVKAVAEVFEDEYYYAAAILRDVIHSTPLSFRDLLDKGVPTQVVEAVDAMTRRKWDTYYEHLMRVKAHPVARAIKLAEISHIKNIADSSEPTGRNLARQQKYKTAYTFLTGDE